MVLNTRLNWTRFVEGNSRPSVGFDLTDAGFPAYMEAASTRAVMPTIDFDQFTDIGNSGGDTTPFDSFQIFVSATKIKGRHTLKFGADIREAARKLGQLRELVRQLRLPRRLRPRAARQLADAGIRLGHGDVCAGYPTGGNFQINAFRTQQAKYFVFFLQDDFRPRSNLTFNLGLRFDADRGTTERFNRSINGFDPTAVNPVTQQAEANYARTPMPGGFRRASSPPRAACSSRGRTRTTCISRTSATSARASAWPGRRSARTR